jgi:hypothetical protein
VPTRPSGDDPWANFFADRVVPPFASARAGARTGTAGPASGGSGSGGQAAGASSAPAFAGGGDVFPATNPSVGPSTPAAPPLPPVGNPAPGPLNGTHHLAAASVTSATVAAPGDSSATAAPQGASDPPAGAVAEVPGHPTLAQAYAQLPLAFEENVGQTDPQVRFLSRGPGFGLFLTGDAATLSLARPGNPQMRDVLRLQFQGASPSAQVVGQQELPSRSNYFTGSDPTAWHQDVTQYAQVRYQGLYPGVDLVYYGCPTDGN